MSPEQDAIERAQAVYDDINGRTSHYRDFEPSQLERSRHYFDLSTPELRTRSFDVLTSLVGLEIPGELQHSFTQQLDDILELLPDSTRVYRVRPQLMHWESHIIRRPGEPEPSMAMDDIVALFTDALAGITSFEISYRGFFLAPDGTIAFQGYGPTADLRSRLRAALPFSSSRQNETGHVSVARILDSVGEQAFQKLLEMRELTAGKVLGVLPVDEVKLVVERRWYMEDYELMAAVPLGHKSSQKARDK